MGTFPWQAEANASLRPTVESRARSCPLWLRRPSQLFSIKVHLKLQTWKAVGESTPPTPPPRAMVTNGSYISDGYLVLGSNFQTELHSSVQAISHSQVKVFLNLPVPKKNLQFQILSWDRNNGWRRKWQPTPVLLPGKPHRWKSLVGYSPWDLKGLDMTEQLHFLSQTIIMTG